MIAAIVSNAILGAIWRRWLGTASTGPRSVKFLVGALLTWPLWLVLPPLYAVIGGALCLLFWADGHEVDKPSVWLRYGPFALPYVLARKYWPDNWKHGRWLDGWMAAGEYGIGFLFWGSVALLSLI